MHELPTPTDSDFFEAVERYVTPAMAVHGYVVCSEGEGKASDNSRTLIRVPGWRTRGPLRNFPRLPRRKRLARHLSVGYEGDSGWEYWVEYIPERQGLDLTWWRDVLGDRADFDVSGDEPLERNELRRRLHVLGEAVRAADTLEDS